MKVRRVKGMDGELSVEPLRSDEEELLISYDELDTKDQETLRALAKTMRKRKRGNK